MLGTKNLLAAASIAVIMAAGSMAHADDLGGTVSGGADAAGSASAQAGGMSGNADVEAGASAGTNATVDSGNDGSSASTTTAVEAGADGSFSVDTVDADNPFGDIEIGDIRGIGDGSKDAEELAMITADLTPEQRMELNQRCKVVQSNPDLYGMETAAFCEAVVKQALAQ